jgi:hypothetical protein
MKTILKCIGIVGQLGLFVLAFMGIIPMFLAFIPLLFIFIAYAVLTLYLVGFQYFITFMHICDEDDDEDDIEFDEDKIDAVLNDTSKD